MTTAQPHGDAHGVPGHDLAALVAPAAHLLPAQGPISVFIHHNTLHAFEEQRFEAAVVEGGERFGCNPFLTEERYRKELGRGRILVSDLRDVLERELGEAASVRVGGVATRIAFRKNYYYVPHNARASKIFASADPNGFLPKWHVQPGNAAGEDHAGWSLWTLAARSNRAGLGVTSGTVLGLSSGPAIR